ncbi:MAG: hypothetical protein WAO56_04535 [Miniphocaeibacter sp.]|uniref:hypothetical protein n=1 Tax=Miniphocaeibacter sp. TaxID=3100973 RepID=UPI0017D9D278|nr:hypothetical protein [Gallicola sp.]
MGKYTFEDLKKDLSINREVEINYKGVKFAIVNDKSKHNYSWFFIVESEMTISSLICSFEDNSRLQEFIDNLTIDNIPLKNIIDSEQYEDYTIF